MFFAFVLGAVASHSSVSVPQGPLKQGTQIRENQRESRREFISTFFVTEPRRLALTPRFDGRIEEEEWDELSSERNERSYFQWAPGKLYFAAMAPEGRDVILSFDFKSNGWLVGNDNIEVRISQRNRGVIARRLDATNPNAPAWVNLTAVDIASLVHIGREGRSTVYEVELRDPEFGLFNAQNEQKFGIRVDFVPENTPQADPFQPRVVTPVQLGLYRAQGLPSGMTFAPRDRSPMFEPGGTARIRFGFTGNEKTGVDKIGVRSEGVAKDETSLYVTPFPAFDRHGHAIVEYVSAIRRKAPVGWHVVRGTLSTFDNLTSIIQASYFIAPQVEILVPARVLSHTAKQTHVRLDYYVVSHANELVEGTVSLVPPPGFTVISDPAAYFSIYSAHGQIGRNFDLEWGNVRSGTYPIEFMIKRGNVVTSVREFITVDAKTRP